MEINIVKNDNLVFLNNLKNALNIHNINCELSDIIDDNKLNILFNPISSQDLPKEYIAYITKNVDKAVLDNAKAIFFSKIDLLSQTQDIPYLSKKSFYIPLETEHTYTALKEENELLFFVSRFLLAYQYITFDEFYKECHNLLDINNKVCITLPEQPNRINYFNNINKDGFTILPGIKYTNNIYACGMSYLFIIKLAKEHQFKNIAICEDDVIFTEEYDFKIQKIYSFLNNQKDWNIFSGIMANSDKVDILKIDKYEDINFIKVNHMISMVFNIYNQSIYNTIIGYLNVIYSNEEKHIDEYLNELDLKVFTVCPFLVGHNDGFHSTITNNLNSDEFDCNSIYNGIIAASQFKPESKIEDYLFKEQFGYETKSNNFYLSQLEKQQETIDILKKEINEIRPMLSIKKLLLYRVKMIFRK